MVRWAVSVAARNPRFLAPFSVYDGTSDSGSKRGLLSFAGLVWQGAVRFLTNTLVGRIGGPSLLGSVATAVSSAQILVLLWPTSVGSAASKYVASARGRGSPDEALTIAGHLATRTFQATIVLGILAAAGWAYFEGSWLDASVVALLFAGYATYAYTKGLQFGCGQVRRATKWDVVTGTIGIAGVLAALIVGVRSPAVLLPLASTYLLFGVGNWPRDARVRPVRSVRRELDVFVALGVVGTLASGGFLQSSVLVARMAGGAQGAGQYAAALTLATPGAMAAASLSLVLFPDMAATWGAGDHAGFRRQTDRATHLLAFAMTGIFGFLVLVGGSLVNIIWGDRYSLTVTLLPILLSAIWLNSLSVACVSSITTRSIGGMAISMASSLSGLTVGIIAWAILIPRWGPVGVAVGYLVGVAVIAGVPVALVWHRDKHAWGFLWLRVVTGVLVVVAMLVAERIIGKMPLVDIAFAIAYLLVWAALMHSEAITILRRILPL